LNADFHSFSHETENEIMSSILKFRPATPDDEPFLRALRAQFDEERLFVRFWNNTDDEFTKKILDFQYNAFNNHYLNVKNNWETRDNIIELDGQPIGRFIVCGDTSEIRLADIVVEKKYRGLGIGQAVLNTTKAECAESKRRLTLHVDKDNRAVSFYLNQGFSPAGETTTHYLLEWKPVNLPSNPVYFFPNQPKPI
jgi:ribosomal protein S18 acetylase RimI-like enzyme